MRPYPWMWTLGSWQGEGVCDVAVRVETCLVHTWVPCLDTVDVVAQQLLTQASSVIMLKEWWNYLI